MGSVTVDKQLSDSNKQYAAWPVSLVACVLNGSHIKPEPLMNYIFHAWNLSCKLFYTSVSFNSISEWSIAVCWFQEQRYSSTEVDFATWRPSKNPEIGTRNILRFLSQNKKIELLHTAVKEEKLAFKQYQWNCTTQSFTLKFAQSDTPHNLRFYRTTLPLSIGLAPPDFIHRLES